MSSGAVVAAGQRSHHLYAWFDHEAAAVVTILLGLFQLLLSVPLAYANQTLPKFFILPLVLGVLIVTGGSFTFANERNSSRLLLRGCACSNVVGLLGALLAFCLYCYSLSVVSNTETCANFHQEYRMSPHKCPGAALAAYCWSLTLLLLLYDTGAVVLHCSLTVSALKALKTD
ncbi:uncharacterized protein si:dkey-9i23.16 [Pseudoliparis swirei]|uniref:uncharacterized protein si:dkey-9i23.16 n=1 Tax=Pseudoliparis swirei TaxID=2059687 RepID=UPI0024BD7248|nr:uncharacterized protein si:dkey-9i23.16 [Pseudoliparis swirei]